MRYIIPVLILTVATSFTLAAIGPNARYLEELGIGGGYNDPVDGGADLDRQGNISASGDLLVDGDGAFGAIDGSDHALTVTVDSGLTAALNLYETDPQNGAGLRYNGATNQLQIGTYNNTTTLTPAITIEQGNNGIAVGGKLELQDSVWLQAASNNMEFNVPSGFHLRFYENNTERYRMTADHFHARNNEDLGLVSRRWGTIYAESLDLSEALAVTSGAFDVGVDTDTRGVLSLWDGSSGSEPGTLSLASPNGTVWYLFIEDDGTLKVSSSLPTQNTDGAVVGLQF